MFEELGPSALPLFKKHIRLGHAGIVDHSVDGQTTQWERNSEKQTINVQWTRGNTVFVFFKGGGRGAEDGERGSREGEGDKLFYNQSVTEATELL